MFPKRHHQVCWSWTLRPRVQPVLLHHRSEHPRLAIPASWPPRCPIPRHGSLLPDPEGAHHLEEGTWRTLGTAAGAVLIIMTSATGWQCQGGKHLGRPFCMSLQLYRLRSALSLFKNPWWESIRLHHQQVDVPLGHHHYMAFHHQPRDEHRLCPCSDSTWWETGYVVFFGTFPGYICMMIGQKTLRPTVVSVYNLCAAAGIGYR